MQKQLSQPQKDGSFEFVKCLTCGSPVSEADQRENIGAAEFDQLKDQQFKLMIQMDSSYITC